MAFSSGNPAVDRYIAEDYETVRGMSSAFAATICGHIIRRQTELGITGHIAEIGTFEGRFFIAMALGLGAGERALGIDLGKRFVLVLTPDNHVEYRPVTLGQAVGELRIITAGLKPGDKVVVSGLQKVRPGDPVTPNLSAKPITTAELATLDPTS